MNGAAPRRAAAFLVLAALAACGTDDDAAESDAAARTAAVPCEKAGGGRYPAPPAPVNDVLFGTSPKARRERQDGCAGVRFHVDRAGGVKDATLLIEEPPGYGFGTAALEGLAETVYDPKSVKPDWYYYVAVFQPRKPKPPRPPIQ